MTQTADDFLRGAEHNIVVARRTGEAILTPAEDSMLRDALVKIRTVLKRRRSIKQARDNTKRMF